MRCSDCGYYYHYRCELGVFDRRGIPGKPKDPPTTCNAMTKKSAPKRKESKPEYDVQPGTRVIVVEKVVNAPISPENLEKIRIADEITAAISPLVMEGKLKIDEESAGIIAGKISEVFYGKEVIKPIEEPPVKEEEEPIEEVIVDA